MHAAIAGLSSGVATMVVGYSVKGHGIMSDVMGGDAMAEGLVVPITEFVDGSHGLEQIKAAWLRRGEIAEKLRRNLPEVIARAERNFSMLVSFRAAAHRAG
jgi:colanic acid/amylovoran biosynthesis protein